MFRLYPLLALLLTTADPSASTKTQEVLSYLQTLPSHTNHRVLSGQFIGYVGQEDANKFQRIYDATQHYPALMSVDYAEFDNTIWEFNVNTYLINQYYFGGLVEVSIHLNNPTDNKWNTKEVNWSDLEYLGTETNTNLNIQLDRLIVGLSELQKAGVVVLFRPLMEANGDWFWWGSRSRECVSVDR